MNHSLEVTAWLDHCICTQQMYKYIRSVSVLKDFVSSDHLPMSICCEFTYYAKGEDKPIHAEHKLHVDWSKASHNHIRKYTELSEAYLYNLDIPLEILECHDPNCKSASHHKSIDILYHDLTECLAKAGREAIGEKCTYGYKCNIIPG